MSVGRRKVHVYDVTDGGSSLSEKKVIDGHLKAVHALAPVNDGTKLASETLAMLYMGFGR
jgi:hypothetical protein